MNIESSKYYGSWLGSEIEAFFEKESFESEQEESFFGINVIATKEDALTRALEFEKSSLQYYERMAKLLGECEELRTMINEEKSHVKEVTRNILNQGSLYRGMDDNYFEAKLRQP